MNLEILLRKDSAILIRLCLLLLVVGSCTSRIPSTKVLPLDNLAPTKSDEVPTSYLPFEFRVVGEHNDGEYIHVLGEIRSSVPWALNNVVVRMSGLSSGETVREVSLPLARALVSRPVVDMAKGVMVPDEPIKFTVSLPVEGVRDYQLELLWGADAKSVLMDSNRNRESGLILRKIRIEREEANCPVRPCESVFRVIGEFYNAGTIKVQKAVLGVGFFSLKEQEGLDMKRAIPENEEEIRVNNLDLLPGSSRPFKILLDRRVPENLASKISPGLRVVSYD